MAKDATEVAIEQEAERRRKQADKAARSALPPHVLSIVDTSVTYVLSPALLPFGQLDGAKLKELLHTQYRLSFQPPEISLQQLGHLGVDPKRVTEDALFSYLLSLNEPQLIFRGGRYPTGPNAFVPIESLSFTSESIKARVAGVTDVADVVVADGFNLFWQAVGSPKKWDSAETRDLIQLVWYSTTTKADLGVAAERLLAPKLAAYLNNQLNDDTRLAARMSAYSRYDGFKPSQEVVATWSFDDITIQVHAFNRRTGRSETSKVGITTTTKDERGRGIVRIESQLAFDEHARFIQAIAESLRD